MALRQLSRSGHFFDYYCRSAFFFPSRVFAAWLLVCSREHLRLFCLYERTHARTSAPVLTARAVEVAVMLTHAYICTRYMDERRRMNLDARGVVNDGLALLTMITGGSFLVLFTS